MKRMTTATLLLVAIALAVPAIAGEESVTLEGKVICAKCTLKDEGLTQCQNVLVVKKDDMVENYYLVKNEANAEFGDVCTMEKQVRVTGTVSEKDGKMWLAATKITSAKKEG
jgi:hypothetical protein